MFYFNSSFIAWRENINKLYACAKLLRMYYAISHHFNTIRIQILTIWLNSWLVYVVYLFIKSNGSHILTLTLFNNLKKKWESENIAIVIYLGMYHVMASTFIYMAEFLAMMIGI